MNNKSKSKLPIHSFFWKKVESSNLKDFPVGRCSSHFTSFYRYEKFNKPISKTYKE